MEQGFSANKQCFVEDVKEGSLTARRLFYDKMSVATGVAEVDVAGKMINIVRGANIRWKEALQRNKHQPLDLITMS